MRTLSPSERRLLFLFGGAVFLALNLLLIRHGLILRSALSREAAELRTALAEDRMGISSTDDFSALRDWITRNPPPALSSDAASTTLLHAIRKTAADQKLTITEESLLPSSRLEDLSLVDLQLHLSGDFFQVVRMLFELQKPELWRAIPKISLKSGSTPSDTLVEMQIRQYHTAGEPTQPPAEE